MLFAVGKLFVGVGCCVGVVDCDVGGVVVGMGEGENHDGNKLLAFDMLKGSMSG